MQKIYAASACLPGKSHRDAVAGICAGIAEAGIQGNLSPAKIQLCPQHYTAVTEESVDALVAEHPEIEFRLHASVRLAKHAESISAQGGRAIWDASNAHQERGQIWFKEAARVSRRLKAPAYTAHAGVRENASLDQMASNVRSLEDLFGCRVGVEGLFPTPGDIWLLSSWEEYAWLLESGIDYALDLSHINIVARRSDRCETTLVAELLESPRCIEIHVSDNNGRDDEHKPIEAIHPWWWSLLAGSGTKADVFSEGNQMRLRKKEVR